MGQGGSMVGQVGLSGSFGEEGFIRKRFGKFRLEVGSGRVIM
jgi:hypothetical protein